MLDPRSAVQRIVGLTLAASMTLGLYLAWRAQEYRSYFILVEPCGAGRVLRNVGKIWYCDLVNDRHPIATEGDDIARSRSGGSSAEDK